MPNKCGIGCVCILHGHADLSVADDLLYGGDGHIPIDETAGACVTGYMAGDALGDADVTAYLLNLLVVVAVAPKAEEVIKVPSVLVVQLLCPSVEQGEQGDVYGCGGLDGNVGEPQLAVVILEVFGAKGVEVGVSASRVAHEQELLHDLAALRLGIGVGDVVFYHAHIVIVQPLLLEGVILLGVIPVEDVIRNLVAVHSFRLVPIAFQNLHDFEGGGFGIATAYAPTVEVTHPFFGEVADAAFVPKPLHFLEPVLVESLCPLPNVPCGNGFLHEGVEVVGHGLVVEGFLEPCEGELHFGIELQGFEVVDGLTDVLVE